MASKPLPPLPVPAKRSLPPPSRKSAFSFEAKTAPKNPTASEFVALASVFDELTPAERTDFVELAFYFKGMPAGFRKKLIEAAATAGKGKKT